MENFYDNLFSNKNAIKSMRTGRQYITDEAIPMLPININQSWSNENLHTRRRISSGQLSLNIPQSNWGSGPSSLSPNYSSCEPVGTPNNSLEKESFDKPRYKTELCKRFAGCSRCEYGGKCQYAHGSIELRLPSHHPKYKSQYCEAYHQKGSCLYGKRCDFIHSETPEKLSEIRYLISLYQKYKESFPKQGRDVTIHELLQKARQESEREEEMCMKSMIFQQACRQQILIDSFLSAPHPSSAPSRISPDSYTCFRF